MTGRGPKDRVISGTPSDRLDATLDDRPYPPVARVARVPGDGGLWRGPSEARWIVRLLHGAPPPRDSAPSIAGLVAQG